MEPECAAASFLEECSFGESTTVDAFELATLCGLRLKPASGEARVEGGVLLWDFERGHREQQIDAFQALARWLLERLDLPRSEDAVAQAARALQLPAQAFGEQLERHSVDLVALRDHFGVPIETVGWRIADLSAHPRLAATLKPPRKIAPDPDPASRKTSS